jgi:hypothetical protein
VKVNKVSLEVSCVEFSRHEKRDRRLKSRNSVAFLGAVMDIRRGQVYEKISLNLMALAVDFSIAVK